MRRSNGASQAPFSARVTRSLGRSAINTAGGIAFGVVGQIVGGQVAQEATTAALRPAASLQAKLKVPNAPAEQPYVDAESPTASSQYARNEPQSRDKS